MKHITTRVLTTLSAEAQATPRRRKNFNLHEGPEAAVQRFCNAIEPDSYIRPHRHPEANKWELLVALRGSTTLLTFDGEGRVAERVELQAGGDVMAVELAPGTWHTLVGRAPGSVLLEIKEGPYIPAAANDFATWAPEEGTTGVAAFLEWLRAAQVGSVAPALATTVQSSG